MSHDERMTAYYAARDPRSAELKARYDDALRKHRNKRFWEALEQPATRPARSAESIVRRLLSAKKRRAKR